MKTVSFSIRDFALPSPRTGSIDAYSGYGRALDGIELHQEVQTKRAKDDPLYQAEVKLTAEFEREGYQFVIEGRMDGIFLHDRPKIEEIKSTFNIRELYKVLSEKQLKHPYYLQLLTYGHFYQMKNGVTPELNFLLISSRNKEILELSVEYHADQYEAWLNLRLGELVKEAKLAEKRSARRKLVAEKFPFPFVNPRAGQMELIASVVQGLQEEHRMLVQAPTGLGKTVGVLYPALKESLARGQRVVYVTPKNSQHSVAEDAIERFQESGAALKSLTLTAKSKMCFKAEPLCNPAYCEFAKDYYDKVAEHELIAALAKKKKLTDRVFRKMGEEYQVCPYQLQLDASAEADALICDYNYVFSPQSALGKVTEFAFTKEGKPNLVVDEAHNLPARAMAYFSPELSSFTLENMRRDIRELPKRFAKEVEELLDDSIEVLVFCQPPGATKTVKIDPDLSPFLEHNAKLKATLSRYLDSDVEIQPKDPLLKLCFYWSAFTEILEQISEGLHPEFFITFQPAHTGGAVKITCCDASKQLEPCYDEYENVVAFSATLKPFEYYAKLSGLQLSGLKISEFQSPFAKKNRKVLIIPQISTKYSEREKNYSRIAEVISKISAVKSGNYFVFFPSFDFLERVLVFLVPPSGFRVVKQERYMKNADSEALIESLRDNPVPTLVFAVQGGIFSEGVDYPGKMIIGAFIVGPPLPNFDVERETMRKYYDEIYHAGFDYAYTYPAMAKAIQAAGRVVRSETDRGIIVLLDNRFLETTYAKTMPNDWFSESPRELVSQSILKEVADFWEEGEQPSEMKLMEMDQELHR